jgi:hypothetical protein
MKNLLTLLFALFFCYPLLSGEKLYVINAKNVRLYKDASLQSWSLVVKKGSSVKKLEEKNEFWLVEYKNDKYYVLKVFLKEYDGKRDIKRKSGKHDPDSSGSRGLLDDMRDKLEELDDR